MKRVFHTRLILKASDSEYMLAKHPQDNLKLTP